MTGLTESPREVCQQSGDGASLLPLPSRVVGRQPRRSAAPESSSQEPPTPGPSVLVTQVGDTLQPPRGLWGILVLFLFLDFFKAVILLEYILK